jgi:hypothetical protein
MTQIIFKTEIDQRKIDVLFSLFKSWGVEAEVKEPLFKSEEEQDLFAGICGMWKDRDIDAKELRNEAAGYVNFTEK